METQFLTKEGLGNHFLSSSPDASATDSHPLKVKNRSLADASCCDSSSINLPEQFGSEFSSSIQISKLRPIGSFSRSEISKAIIALASIQMVFSFFFLDIFVNLSR